MLYYSLSEVTGCSLCYVVVFVRNGGCGGPKYRRKTCGRNSKTKMIQVQHGKTNSKKTWHKEWQKDDKTENLVMNNYQKKRTIPGKENNLFEDPKGSNTSVINDGCGGTAEKIDLQLPSFKKTTVLLRFDPKGIYIFSMSSTLCYRHHLHSWSGSTVASLDSYRRFHQKKSLNKPQPLFTRKSLFCSCTGKAKETVKQRETAHQQHICC